MNVTQIASASNSDPGGAEPHRSQTRVWLATPPQPGAIAIIELAGPAALTLTCAITGRPASAFTTARTADLAGIDQGLVVVLNANHVQWMPHGGPAVIAQLMEAAGAHGACVTQVAPAPANHQPHDLSKWVMPELPGLTAEVAQLLPYAASPAAVDLLAAQPALWEDSPLTALQAKRCLERSNCLDALIDPPRVAVLGAANVGKSTLHNYLAHRTASHVSDQPGTTRDWVGSDVMLVRHPPDTEAQASHPAGVVVRWMDTPGIRADAEDEEQQALRQAVDVMREADVIISLREASGIWPQRVDIQPDLWAVTKQDAGPAGGAGCDPLDPLAISGATGFGIAELQTAILRCLGLDALSVSTRWAFTPELRDRCQRRIEAASSGEA